MCCRRLRHETAGTENANGGLSLAGFWGQANLIHRAHKEARGGEVSTVWRLVEWLQGDDNM